MDNNTKRRFFTSLGLTLAILLIGMTISAKLSKNKKSNIGSKIAEQTVRSVSVVALDAGSQSNIIKIDGRLIPYEKVDIYAKVTGVISGMPKPFKPGSTFQKGETIFVLDDREDRFALISQRSQLLNSITQIMPDLKFDYPESFEKWQKYLSAFQLEQSTAPLPKTSTDQEKYFVASKNIFNQYYGIKSTETRLSEYVIKSPISGTITNATAYTGVLVRPGAALGTIINPTSFELEAPVPYKDLQSLKIGQSVELYSSDVPTKWQGVIQRIGTKIDEATQYIPIYVKVTGSNLKEGMYLSGTVKGTSFTNVVAIDKKYMPDQNSVFVVVDSVIRKKEIQVVRSQDNLVIAKGIGPNDRVVNDAISGLFDGQRVNIK